MLLRAGEYKQARYYTKKLLKITYVCVAILVLFIILILPLILKAYNLSDITALEASKILILHGCCAIIIWPAAFNIPSALRAAGDVKYCMIVSIISMWVCRIIFSYILGKYMGFGVFGVWIAMILDWIARSIFFIIRYRGSKWENKQVV